MRARFFLIASAFAPVCGTCGMSIGVPVVLKSDSFSRLPAVGACAWAIAGQASTSAEATHSNAFFMSSSLAPIVCFR